MKSTIETISEGQVINVPVTNVVPANTQIGDIWFDTSNTGALPGSVLMKVSNGGTGAHTHTISSNINWTTISNLVPTYSFRDDNDQRYSASEREIVTMFKDREELKKLCAEQPAVQEAFDRLQTLIKLYRE